MYVIENHDIPVAGGASNVVHNVTKDDPILRGGNLDISLDVGKVIGGQNKWLKWNSKLNIWNNTLNTDYGLD